MNQIFFHQCGANQGLNKRLVAYYSFNNNNANDSLGNHNGTVVGTPTFVSGKVGNAIDFVNNDSLNNITIPDSNDFSFTDGTNDLPFSMSFWVNITANSSVGNVIISKRGTVAGNSEWQFTIFNISGFLQFTKIDKTNLSIQQNARHNTTLSLSTWYHFVITDNGTKTFSGMKIYINGVSVSLIDNSVGGTYTGMGNSTVALTLGNATQGFATTIKHRGLIDEVAIWKNRELTAAEVTQIYNSGIGITYPL